MGRPSNSAERRSQIVSALRAVMARSGYAGATIAEVARVAGLAPGLIHYHFKDKREILVALVEELSGYANTRFLSRSEACVTASERLAAYVDAYLAYGPDAQPDAVAAWVMVGEQAAHDPEVREVYHSAMKRQMALLKQLLRKVLAERGCRARGVDALAAGIMAYIQGAFVLATTVRPLLPAGFAAPMLTRLIDRYIEAEGIR
jgi:TetR/AcrR family transcriptional repressor of bet genes